MKHAIGVGILCGICMGLPGNVLADYYDNFDDGQYGEDPNAWDIDDPCWIIFEPLGQPNAVIIDDGWLRLWTTSGWFPYSFMFAYAYDGNDDPNTSATVFDNTAPHYLLARVKINEPNVGGCTFLMHGNPQTWECYLFEYEAYVNDFIFTHLTGFNFTFGLRKRLTGPNEPDEVNGFWMCFQFDNDPNAAGDPNDPNNHWFRAAVWNGGKFDWDGQWFMELPIINANWSGLDYFTWGFCGLVASGSPDIGQTADNSYDDIECRWGTFSNVSHTLKLLVTHSDYGTVALEPNLVDPADPNLQRYTDGTEIVLSATPISGKAFGSWTIWDDPNRYPDSNYAVVDSNFVLYLTMDHDYTVEAAFKCGSGTEPLLVVPWFVMGLVIIFRRLA